MRYELNDEGYLCKIFFGCNSGSCIEYTGTIPTGYDSIEQWEETEENKIGAWKIVNGNLVFDNAKWSELQSLYEQQTIDNSYVLHKEIYEMQENIEDVNDINASQYQSASATGKVITIDNVKKAHPKVILNNIEPYSFDTKIDIITTNKNMLPNTATTQTINGITFTQNENRSITIQGTSTASIEYNIAGTSTNTSAFLCFKKNLNYYLTCGITMKMNYYDGTNRTEIYSGTGGAITFSDSNKLVTQIVLSIANGTTLDTTIYPQLEYGSNASDYVMNQTKTLTIDLSNYISIRYASLKSGITKSGVSKALSNYVDYISIQNGDIYAKINGKLINIGSGNVSLFDGYDTIYTLQDANIEIDYCINALNVDNLDVNDLSINDLGFIQGKATTTNKFKILSDGSIEAHNGYFSGDIYLSEGGKVIGGTGILTNLVYNGFVRGNLYVGNGDYVPLGRTGGGETLDTQRNELVFTFDLPYDFTVISAKAYLYHVPITWKDIEGVNITGYSRNLKLYRGTSLNNLKIEIDPTYGSITTTGAYVSEITDALGSGGFTGSSYQMTDVESIELKDYINSNSENYFVVKDSNNVVYSSNNDIFGCTGGVFGYIEIIGYKSI